MKNTVKIISILFFIVLVVSVGFKEIENKPTASENKTSSYPSFEYTQKYINGMQYVIITRDGYPETAISVINITKDRAETDAALKIKNSK